LEELGRVKEAAIESREALSLDPKNSDASLNLPVALFKAGKVDDAIAQARELIKRRPDYADAQHNLNVELEDKAASAR
jgi:predicted Zn-dependent protease